MMTKLKNSKCDKAPKPRFMTDSQTQIMRKTKKKIQLGQYIKT